MTAPLYAIGRFCSRHHWPVIAVWVVLAVGLVLVGQTGESKTNDNLTLPGTGSTAATELLEDDLPEQAYGSNPLVFQAKRGESLTAPRYATAIGDTLPDARLVVDHLHAIRLASEAVNDVRRRVQQDTTGHRGRKGDPLYGIRRLLLMLLVRFLFGLG